MKKHTLKEWFIAVRPWSLPASVMPIVTTLAFLFFSESDVNWLHGLWALIGMILFHLTGNVWSDYFDFKKKVDSDDTFGAKTLTTGMFKPEEIKGLAIGLFVVSVICGLGLVAVTGLPLLYIGIAGAALTLLYPTLKFNALGDLDILLTFAFLPTLGTSYAVTGAIDWSVLWIALPVGLITDGILHSNNTRDVITDKRAGITTMAMGIGSKASAWLYAFEIIFPYVWVCVCSVIGILPFTAFAVLLTLPIAMKCVKPMIHSLGKDSGVIADLDMKTAQLQLAFSLLLTIALVIGKFI
jgi:1,4-dihydroxy-2-naphthoate octaprenyltransferase